MVPEHCRVWIPDPVNEGKVHKVGYESQLRELVREVKLDDMMVVGTVSQGSDRTGMNSGVVLAAVTPRGATVYLAEHSVQIHLRSVVFE